VHLSMSPSLCPSVRSPGTPFFYYSRNLGRSNFYLAKKDTHLLCVGWRNLFSFPVVLLCQFFVLVGNRLWFYILLMYSVVFVVTYALSVQYSCVAGKLILYDFSC
jgi:hypothetical protein